MNTAAIRNAMPPNRETHGVNNKPLRRATHWLRVVSDPSL